MDSTSLVPKSFNELTTIRLILMTFLQLGLNVVQSAFSVITLPYEIKELFPDRPALTLGIIVATSSAFMMMSPLVGFYSDRCTSSWVEGDPSVLLVQHYMFSLSYPYAVSYVVLNVGVVISTSAFAALIAEVVPISQRGFASGIYGVMAILGAAMGFVAVGAAFPIDKTSLSYLVLMAVVVISTVVSMVASPEVPLSFGQRANLDLETPNFATSLKQMLQGLKDRNFALVLLGRLFYNIAVAPQNFLLYMTQDLIHTNNPELAVTILAITAQVVALLTTIPSGKLSDLYGRKIFVYVSTILVIVAFELFVLASSVYVYYGLGVLLGISMGMYATVDMALGMDCLPQDNTTLQIENEEDGQCTSDTAGRNMGLWGTSQAAGGLIGSYMFSPLLEFVGGTGKQDHYTRTGYIVIYSIGSMFAALSAVMVYLIKTKRESRPSM